MKKELIFIGPPGSGKGTQTKMLSNDYKLPHIDTGSLLRDAVNSKSDSGMLVDGFISKGHLVPVGLVSEIIKNRLQKEDCKNGFILDGYPRSLEQAYALDEILKETDKDTEAVKPQVFYFKADTSKLTERLVNRRSCSKCGAIYNLKTMGISEETKCLKCGGTLVRRSDDTEEVAAERFKTYFEQTAPLIDLYKSRNILITLDANLDIDTIYKNLTGAIK